jgi:oligopeptide transport system substrate-binding protein
LSIIVVKDANTIYSLYQNNQVDASGLPRGEQDKVLKDPDLSKQIVQSYDLAVSYIGFAYDKPPFDNVHVRRAFSAMMDRKAMVADLLGGRGAPMAHFMPPGIFGSVGINEVGLGDPKNLGFDPDYAKKEFDQVYPNCEGFPTITFLTEGANFAQYVQNAMKTYLGCDPSKMNIQQADFQVQIQGIKPTVPTPQRPNMWDLAWGPDYLDAQDWIYAVLSCHSENDAKRQCGDLDKQIDDASHETDVKKRAQMYRDLETAFFGTDGEFMIAPLFTGKNYSMYKPWYKGLFDTDALLGGGHWDTRRIDQAAQLAARGGGGNGGTGTDNSSGNSGSGDTTIPSDAAGATPEGTAAP